MRLKHRNISQKALLTSRGASTVEFALVLPVLLALFFGIIELGFLFRSQLVLQQSAREGSRSAAVGRSATEVRDRVLSSIPTLQSDRLTMQMQYRVYDNGTWTSWTTLGTDAEGFNTAPQGAQVRVLCNYDHPLLTGPLFARMVGRPGANSIPINAGMVMRRE